MGRQLMVLSNRLEGQEKQLIHFTTVTPTNKFASLKQLIPVIKAKKMCACPKPPFVSEILSFERFYNCLYRAE